MRHTPNIFPAFGSAQVLTRFFLRLIVFGIFAALSSTGFAKTLESLLTFGAIYCLVAAALRREQPFGRELTHFDEAAAYTVIACLAAWSS
jgi:branched-subunit amino acid transport protein AzlD